MPYTIIYDEEIFKKDFRKIDKQNQQNIIKTIRKKLSMEPMLYGKPLAKELKGYWKLKIGPFRVIYQILQHKLIVHVVTIGFRREEEAYLIAAKRLGLL